MKWFVIAAMASKSSSRAVRICIGGMLPSEAMKRCMLLALLAVAACKKSDPGPACGKLVDHMLEVTKQSMPGHDMQDFGDRKAMIDQCEKRNMSREMRNCLMAAKTLADLGDCQSKGKSATPPAPAQVPAAP